MIVTATSVKSASASASANIAITSSALANGTYVFSLTGEDQVGPAFFVAGAFQVTNGAITGGEQLNTCNARDCSTTDSNVGVSGIETLHGTLVSASSALIAEFDSSATASGSLDRQVATVSALAQGYAFLATGLDSNFLFVSIGGVINVDGTASSGTVSISGTGSVFDINDGFSAIPNQSFAASGVTTPDSFGPDYIRLKSQRCLRHLPYQHGGIYRWPRSHPAGGDRRYVSRQFRQYRRGGARPG